MQDYALEVITRVLLHLVEYDLAGEVVLGVGEGALSQLFDARGADEGRAELVGRVSALDHSAVPELHSSLALVPHRQRVQPRRYVEVVHP